MYERVLRRGGLQADAADTRYEMEKDDDNNFKNLNIVIIYGNYDKSDILEKIRFKVAAGFSGYEK